MVLTSCLFAVCANGLSCSASAGSLTTLHRFAGGSDGGYPDSELLSAAGAVYGVTPGGKIGTATVFKVDPSTGAETQVYAFSKKFYAYGALAYRAPLLYGETQANIFSLDPSAGLEQNVGQSDAANGLSSGNGMLYGTATGDGGAGTIFSVVPRTGRVTVLYTFMGSSQDDGQYPIGGVIVGKHVLYGVTESGGAYQEGTVFGFDLQTKMETLLYSFAGGEDGGGPVAEPVLVDGILYGTTSDGISGTPGTLYSLDPATGVKHVVYYLTGGYNVSVPTGRLCYHAGHLYGVSAFGGANNAGEIYDVDIATAKEKILYSFKSGDGNGQRPEAGLVYANGAFYGTTAMGDGKTYYGTVFRFTP